MTKARVKAALRQHCSLSLSEAAASSFNVGRHIESRRVSSFGRTNWGVKAKQ